MGLIFSKQFVTVLLLIILVLVWSSVWSLFRIAMEAIPPFSFRVIIGLPAFLLLLILGYKKVKTVKIPRNNIKSLLLISFFNVTLWQILMLYGITMLGGGRAAVLTYTMPVWATIFAAIFGYEKINFSIIVSLILGMIGIFFLSIEINIFENLFGFLITLSAGLSWAIGTMIVKYGGIKSDGLIVAGWQQLIGIIPIIPFALYYDLNNFGEIELRHILIIFYGIFFSSAYTYWAYFTVLQKFSVNITSISVMTVPVLAVLIDYFMIDFPFSTLDLFALIFIISGIYIAATRPFNKNSTKIDKSL
ncbi:MAG: EamA family transporter [Proteobacteria bacterium]|jgi:drug/metabolite transporter (DMT)-like permease|nr:EamA family transporter [Pseudomonadota bacterium]